MRTRRVNALIESDRCPSQSFERHRARNVGQPCKPVRAIKRQRPDSAHRLRSIEQSEALFDFQFQWRNLCAFESDGCCESLSFVENFSFANHCEREVCEWREIAARTNASLCGNDRRHAFFKHRNQRLDHQRTRATEPSSQHVRTQQQHRAGFRLGQWITQTDRVTAHKIQLQLNQVRAIDAHVGQLAEARVDSVNSAALRDDILHHLSRLLDAHACIISENNLFPAFCDINDLLESELLTLELKHRLTTNLSPRLRCFGNVDLFVFGGRGFAAAHTLARAFRAYCRASRSCGCPACHSFQ